MFSDQERSVVLRFSVTFCLLVCQGCGGTEEDTSNAADPGAIDMGAVESAAEDSGVDPQIVAKLVAAGVKAEKIGPTFVYASDSQITDEHLKLFATMPELKTLSLGKTKITGSGLKDLNCPKLRSLLLFDTPVTDAEVSQLPSLPALETLSLAGTAIDGTCLEKVSNYSALTALELHNTKVSDAALAPLSKLKALSRLELQDTAITDAGLQPLQDCPELYTLNLANTMVTDDGVIALTQKVQLFNLNLKGTGVTDKLIENLVGDASQKLCILRLKGTKLTSASVAFLGKLQTLEELDVRDTGLAESDVALLREGLESLREINKPEPFEK
ncbi:MAG: hypothetical protein JNM43_00255 [Planctomycetaceae bacterium]|nr:hypothetical protein [Planctomycetaceae bacterium]